MPNVASISPCLVFPFASERPGEIENRWNAGGFADVDAAIGEHTAIDVVKNGVSQRVEMTVAAAVGAPSGPCECASQSGTAAAPVILAVNPRGDERVKGHPLGATGMAQCVELFQKLRDATAIQVHRVRIALAHNIGGLTVVSAVTILEGPETNGG
jgi:acetyl-CoA acetyltransferase